MTLRSLRECTHHRSCEQSSGLLRENHAAYRLELSVGAYPAECRNRPTMARGIGPASGHSKAVLLSSTVRIALDIYFRHPVTAGALLSSSGAEDQIRRHQVVGWCIAETGYSELGIRTQCNTTAPVIAKAIIWVCPYGIPV